MVLAGCIYVSLHSYLIIRKRGHEFEEQGWSGDMLEGGKGKGGIMELYLKYTLQKEVIGKYQRVDMGSQMEVNLLYYCNSFSLPVA